MKRRSFLAAIVGLFAGGGAPELVTAADERKRCCVLVSSDKNDPWQAARCERPAEFWVGTDRHVDDYTHCCETHLGWVYRDGDTIVRLRAKQ